jgi:hypothetical protein
MIQWKANSVKSDTIEQLLQPAELTNGLKAEQVCPACDEIECDVVLCRSLLH